MIEKIGVFSFEVAKTIGLLELADKPIYIGQNNIAHMISAHKKDYYRYFDKIPLIINSPDYVRLDPFDNSISFVKNFNNFIKLAVRIAGDGEYYARTLYELNSLRVERFIADGELLPIKKT